MKVQKRKRNGKESESYYIQADLYDGRGRRWHPLTISKRASEITVSTLSVRQPRQVDSTPGSHSTLAPVAHYPGGVYYLWIGATTSGVDT